MMSRFWMMLGAVLAFVGLVVKGVVYHRLQGSDATPLREILFIASDAHMIHAMAIIVIGVLTVQQGSSRLLGLAAIAFTAGIALFSGGIYSSLGGDAGFRSLTPTGGALLLAGWLLLAAGAYFGKSKT